MVKVKRIQGKKLKPLQAEKKFCAYLHRFCTRPRLDGYLYCISHILEDRSAPFRQCTFVHLSNQKRCTNAAPKNDRHESLCPWHAKQTRLRKASQFPKKYEPENLFSLMYQLEHYCADRHISECDPDDSSKPSASTSVYFDPPDLNYVGSEVIPGHKTCVNDTRIGHSDVSESETDYSDDDEPLKHAGVYTYEEVARIYRDKLIRLQTLYIEEMKYLQHILREKHRDYLHALKSEKRTQGSISNAIPRSTKDERDRYLIFRALYRYHRVFGQEALLHEKSLKRRLELSGRPFPSTLSPANISLCTYTNGEINVCKKRALPLSKFCIDHILSDSKQVLFQHCAGGSGCCKKVIVPCAEDARCLLHSCPEPLLQKQRSLSPIAGPSGMQNISDINHEQEHFQSMDDIASLGLDAVVPGSLFGLNQFGEPDDESTDSCSTYDSSSAYMYQEPDECSNELLSDTHSVPT